MLIIATYARERVKNRGRKRRASVSVIEGAFPIRFPARANKQTNERRVVVEEEFRRKEEDKAVFSIAPFYSGWRAWPCRRRAYQSSSFGRILFSLACDVSFASWWEEKMWSVVCLFHYKDRSILFADLCSKDFDFWERILSLNVHGSLFYVG